MVQLNWKAPANNSPQLVFYNSITKQKEPFIPKQGNIIKWYTCGPTVYDSAHIGHARTYISFDIIRNVLEKYFGYEVIYVMNITDIDDKIINKAQESTKEIKEACLEITKDKIINKAQESTKEIKDACLEITKKYEKEFFEDLDLLDVRRPTFVTRVTEYVDKIVSFIEKIEENGYAYESNGSVYFDLQAYKKNFPSPIFTTPDAIDESESLSEKRHKTDFVLWKKSKLNEPKYPSKWSEGRPGWHIECSVMATDILNELDIHSGGIDLAFPHHENEIIQSQAYLKTDQWVNYFLHSGHLHIQGCKMSKSLKNFITIRDILQTYTPREMRFLFLIHNWRNEMEYSIDTIEYSKKIEQKFSNFVSVVSSKLNVETESLTNSFSNLRITTPDLLNYFYEIQAEVHAHLCNNIDTSKCINSLINLIGFVNKNIDSIAISELKLVYDYVIKICKVFGVSFDESVKESKETKIADLLCKFRNEVRLVGKEKRVNELFGLCDEIRKEAFENGYVMEDAGSSSTIRKRV